MHRWRSRYRCIVEFSSKAEQNVTLLLAVDEASARDKDKNTVVCNDARDLYWPAGRRAQLRKNRYARRSPP
jgi:hypothetical protein